MGMIRNKATVKRDIALVMSKLEEAPVALYRGIVWEIFVRIVMQTPQFSGRAAANWNLSINSPDMSFDPNMGEELELTKSGYLQKAPHEKGDMKWASESLERARYVMRRIRKGDRVYITNATRGDDDGGKSSGSYIADLQSSSYWATKLRLANQPYETAMESAMLVAEGYLANGTMPLSGLEEA